MNSPILGLLVLFKPNKFDDARPRKRGQFTLLSLSIQMLTSPGNTLQTQPEIIFTPWSVKLTHKMDHDSIISIFLFSNFMGKSWSYIFFSWFYFIIDHILVISIVFLLVESVLFSFYQGVNVLLIFINSLDSKCNVQWCVSKFYFQFVWHPK